MKGLKKESKNEVGRGNGGIYKMLLLVIKMNWERFDDNEGFVLVSILADGTMVPLFFSGPLNLFALTKQLLPKFIL